MAFAAWRRGAVRAGFVALAPRLAAARADGPTGSFLALLGTGLVLSVASVQPGHELVALAHPGLIWHLAAALAAAQDRHGATGRAEDTAALVAQLAHLVSRPSVASSTR